MNLINIILITIIMLMVISMFVIAIWMMIKAVIENDRLTKEIDFRRNMDGK